MNLRSCVHIGAGLPGPRGSQRAVLGSPNVARKLSSLHMPQPAHNDGKLHFSFPTFYLRKERKSASCPKPNRPPPLARLRGSALLGGGLVALSCALSSSEATGSSGAGSPISSLVQHASGGLLVSHHPWRFKEDKSTRISTAAVTAEHSALGMQRTCQECPGSGSLAQGRGRGITRSHRFLGSPTDLPQCRGLYSIHPSPQIYVEVGPQKVM